MQQWRVGESRSGEHESEIRVSVIFPGEETLWPELCPGLVPDTPNYGLVPAAISEGSGYIQTTVMSGWSKTRL